ncbi:MAG TPA: translocation/assembly module TamB domain-containing protein, partial [Cyclobacteriaceae bacterium]|nr:translocation/assembly module TamB domain-containing protein [Cyclobacteriaceae bacterium]
KSIQVQDRKTKFKIDELITYFRISQSSMEFLHMELRAGKSYISDSILFKYQSQDDLSDFNDKVSIIAKLKNTVLDPKDLALFTYGLPELPQPITLSGSASGKVTRFVLRNMNLSMGGTQVKGRLSMDGLPDINETFIDLKINEGHVVQSDIRSFIPENFYEVIKPLGRTQVRAEFRGFTNDFVTKGTLATGLGYIQSDLNLKVNERNIGQSTYKGNLSLTDFRLGDYLNDTLNFQQVTLNGRINGKGLTRETADFTLTGQVKSIGVRNYDYVNISTNARFAAQLFHGDFSINDPNLKFNANGFIDFRKGNELIQVKAMLDTAFIDKLGFIKDPLFVRSYFDVNTSGLKLDSLFGSVMLRNSLVKYKDNVLSLDSVHIISAQDGGERQLKVLSSVADFSMQGNYRYTPIYNDLQILANEFYLSLKNDRKALASYYKRKQSSSQFYKSTFELTVHDMRPLAVLGELDLFISPNSMLKGNFSNGQQSVMTLIGKIDTLKFDKKTVIGSEFEFNASKPHDSVRGKSSLTVKSAQQEFNRALKTKNLLFGAEWDRDHVDFALDVDQVGNSNILRMKSELDFLKDSVRIKILPTQLRIFDEYWRVSADNFTLMKEGEWSFNKMKVHHGNELVSLDGFISEDPNKTLTLNIDSLGIDIINSLVLEKVYGTVNGSVQARNLYHGPSIQNNVSIDDLTVDQFLVGNVHGRNEWNRDKKRFDLNFSLEREGKRTVEMNGFYDPSQSVSPLSVAARLENANIKIIEPFMRGIFSNMDGALTGNYTVTGTFLEPILNGTGKIESAQLTIDYLKTKYFFSGELGFNPKQILFKNFNVRDELKNKATLEGSISHRNYNNMRINVDVAFANFQLLNLTAKDNDLFYGQAYSTGHMNMVGPINNLKISGTAKSDKGTRIYIPLGGLQASTVTKKDFVTFVKFSDTLKVDKKTVKAKTKDEPTGITMDLNLDVTPDAYAEIIFDIRSGDIIRGYGKGDIKLQLDTKGDFNMFGDYEFERGNYNFTLYDIINKEFSINRGSRITWLGDPYGGILNINASYKQLVSFGPILQTQAYANSIAMRRKYPAEVQLKIDGAMMSPQINFDIVANDLPNNVPVEAVANAPAGSVQLNNEFKAFKAQLNEQELKRQVFSLIMLRRFSPPDAFATGGSLYSSVSELFSNQLSYWLTQVDQNLEVNFDLGNFDQEAFNTFQLRLSYSFLNGRLRVTRDGAFNNNYTRSEVSNMLGDWTVDYLLTPDGKFKVKMYSRNNINQLLSNSIGSQSAVTTGFSLMNTQNFNHWSDLLTSARERRRKELAKQPKKEEDDDTSD